MNFFNIWVKFSCNINKESNLEDEGKFTYICVKY